MSNEAQGFSGCYSEIESVTCDLCILQRLETSAHLLLRCNFAKACWQSIGITFTSTRSVMQIFRGIRRRLNVSFALEIIVLMSWSIMNSRNEWIFNNVDPSITSCKRKFYSGFNLLQHRASQTKQNEMNLWLALHC